MGNGGFKENDIRQPKLLIVEGSHECDFFTAWLKVLELNNIQVMPIGGKTLLPNSLASLVKQRPFLDGYVSSIVIVRDADDNPGGAFDSVCSALQQAGLPVPVRCLEMTSSRTPAVAIVVVPAETQNGALEELLIETVADDPVLALTRAFIDNAVTILRASNYREPPAPHKLGKAKIHAFLSTFTDPDKHLGTAAKAGVWQYEHKALASLLKILREM